MLSSPFAFFPLPYSFIYHSPSSFSSRLRSHLHSFLGSFVNLIYVQVHFCFLTSFPSFDSAFLASFPSSLIHKLALHLLISSVFLSSFFFIFPFQHLESPSLPSLPLCAPSYLVPSFRALSSVYSTYFLASLSFILLSRIL